MEFHELAGAFGRKRRNGGCGKRAIDELVRGVKNRPHYPKDQAPRAQRLGWRR
jgi:hypothetical protein